MNCNGFWLGNRSLNHPTTWQKGVNVVTGHWSQSTETTDTMTLLCTQKSPEVLTIGENPFEVLHSIFVFQASQIRGEPRFRLSAGSKRLYPMPDLFRHGIYRITEDSGVTS